MSSVIKTQTTTTQQQVPMQLTPTASITHQPCRKTQTDYHTRQSPLLTTQQQEQQQQQQQQAHPLQPCKPLIPSYRSASIQCLHQQSVRGHSITLTGTCLWVLLSGSCVGVWLGADAGERCPPPQSARGPHSSTRPAPGFPNARHVSSSGRAG